MLQSLQDAIAELEAHESLSLKEQLIDCQQPKWERLLRYLVADIEDIRTKQIQKVFLEETSE